MSSSDSEDEVICCCYGTPLEPYEEDEVPSKRRYQQNTEQYAVDAHGKRRFHGAFTGGFSAGHGNTVSTPEGWTPSTFKSSRSERGAFKSRAPEDFMDEEDRDEFGIAPQLIQTQSDFAGQKRPHSAKQFYDGPIPGEPVLEQFVRAVPETAAVRLLLDMGWRPGGGTGEHKPRAKTYGCYVPPEFRQNTSDGESDSSDLDYDTLFAPEDYEPYLLSRKDDRFGLGYSGLSRHSVLGGMTGEYGAEGGAKMSHLKMKDKGKRVSIRGQAFGVGALENEDEDLYSQEDMSHYDFSIGGPSGDSGLEKNKKSEGLDGFVRALKSPPAPRRYPAPMLPRDYIPAPGGFAQTRFTPTKETTDAHRKQGLGRHDLSSHERGFLLGEPSSLPIIAAEQTQLSTEASSDLEQKNETSTSHALEQSDEATDVITMFAGRNVNFVSNARDHCEEAGNEEEVFRPFACDPAKQERYELFLQGEQTEEVKEGGKLEEWEAAREKAEFEQAAKLYKPLTGILKDRFTAGSGSDAPSDKSEKFYGCQDQLAAARRSMYGALTRTRAEWRPESLICKRFNVPDPFGLRPDASKMVKPKSSYSVFEYLEGSIHSKESFTKEQTQFSGSKSLLQNNPTTSSKAILQNNPTSDIVEKQVPSIATRIEPGTSVKIEKIYGNKRMTVADLFLMEAEKERLNKVEDMEVVTQTIDKFDKMELYNAIFMSDSEDEDLNDEKMEKTDENFKGSRVNIERNTSPPRGIFANLDFDKLNSWPAKSKSSEDDPKEKYKKQIPNTSKQKIYDETSSKEKDKIRKHSEKEDEMSKTSQGNKTPEKVKIREMDISELFKSPRVNESDLYGPKIPENLKKKIEMSAIEPDETIFYGNTSVSKTAYKELDIEDVLLNNNSRPELPKPLFRDKNARQKSEEVLEIGSSSSDSEAWIDISKAKIKKQKKKKKKHKHKSKHKKKKDKYE